MTITVDHSSDHHRMRSSLPPLAAAADGSHRDSQQSDAVRCRKCRRYCFGARRARRNGPTHAARFGS